MKVRVSGWNEANPVVDVAAAEDAPVRRLTRFAIRSLRLAAWLVIIAAGPVMFADQLQPAQDHEPGVPQGKVIQMPPWKSQVYPETTRDWWIYVPASYRPDSSAALMVFQDGFRYVDPKGEVRVPAVFDQLIARGEMPVTLGVFINPGQDPGKDQPKSPVSGSNRDLEYNSLDSRYARFLLDEILPEVAKLYPFSNDPEMRAIGGASSGAICAFTVAWERPDQFHKVFSMVGSFTNIRAGNNYPALVRKTERKPLRVYLQDSSGDLNNTHGHWPIANLQMQAALRYMGYDVHLEFAEGYKHSYAHGGMIFPQAMRWLWRKDKPAPKIDTKGDLAADMTLLRLLIDGEGWKVAAETVTSADAACTDAEGNFYFADPRAGGIFRLEPDGTKKKLSEEGASGMKFGPDGRLYACLGAKKHIFALDLSTGAMETIATEVVPNDFVITNDGHIYFTETAKKQVSFVDVKAKVVSTAAGGIAGPNGICLSPDQGTLAVSESQGRYVWAFRINPDGILDGRESYMTLRRPIDPKGEFKPGVLPPYVLRGGGDGMTTDMAGRYYVGTVTGVQVFDPTGRLCGVMEKPQADKGVTSCVLAGPRRDTLYVSSGNKVYSRRIQATGSPAFSPSTRKL